MCICNSIYNFWKVYNLSHPTSFQVNPTHYCPRHCFAWMETRSHSVTTLWHQRTRERTLCWTESPKRCWQWSPRWVFSSHHGSHVFLSMTFRRWWKQRIEKPWNAFENSHPLLFVDLVKRIWVPSKTHSELALWNDVGGACGERNYGETIWDLAAKHKLFCLEKTMDVEMWGIDGENHELHWCQHFSRLLTLGWIWKPDDLCRTLCAQKTLDCLWSTRECRKHMTRFRQKCGRIPSN